VYRLRYREKREGEKRELSMREVCPYYQQSIHTHGSPHISTLILELLASDD